MGGQTRCGARPEGASAAAVLAVTMAGRPVAPRGPLRVAARRSLGGPAARLSRRSLRRAAASARSRLDPGAGRVRSSSQSVVQGRIAEGVSSERWSAIRASPLSKPSQCDQRSESVTGSAESARSHACVLACLRACVLACLRACVHACLRACVLPCVHACRHTCLCACLLPCFRACVLT